MNWSNKEDVRAYMRAYKKQRRKNDAKFLEKYRAERRAWYKRKSKSPVFKKLMALKMKLYYFKKPWLKSGTCAKYRCTNPNHDFYYRYGGRGIKYLLTNDELETLWKRDALDLKDATLDRIDNDGHYTFKNCRFIERSENSKRQFYSKKTVTA